MTILFVIWIWLSLGGVSYLLFNLTTKKYFNKEAIQLFRKEWPIFYLAGPLGFLSQLLLLYANEVE